MSPAAPDPNSEFPPIGDYAFLSDCHTCALVAPDGAVEWMCVPRFDSPSMFAAILDRRAGRFRLGPKGLRVPVARRYVPGTNVLETAWMTDTGWVTVFDAMVLRPPREHDGRVVEQESGPQRPHGADEARGILIRAVNCTHGKVDLEMACEPAFEYMAASARWSQEADGSLLAHSDPGSQRFRLVADFDLQVRNEQAYAEHLIDAGNSAFCALCFGDDLDGPETVEEAFSLVSGTQHFWRRWLELGSFPDHPWRVFLQRSAIVLKGLTYAPSGAMVAAATTSLPETVGGSRNWDYRYTWVRDTTFALWALHVLGFDTEAREFLEFATQLCHGRGPEAQIMFGIGGEVELTEHTLDWLGGYMNSSPVRIGNGAFEQRQNDVFGVLLDAIYVHCKARGDVPDDLWEVAHDQVVHAMASWRHPDQGIWEARGEPRHYVSSKLYGWVALDRGARMARWRGEAELARGWTAEAEEIRAEILSRGLSDRGVFRQHYDTDALDASTLLVPLVRFLPPNDPRVVETVNAIADELSEDGLVLRYLPDETDDGLGGQREGSFAICSFWLVSALSEIGERKRAKDLCNVLLSFSGSLGLFSEEIDAASGHQLGNFPQAFTHLALINAVSHVIADDLMGERTEVSGVFSEMRPLGS
jgi:GH15 family glucan-1,4-alpha-glucosidase